MAQSLPSPRRRTRNLRVKRLPLPRRPVERAMVEREHLPRRVRFLGRMLPLPKPRSSQLLLPNVRLRSHAKPRAPIGNERNVGYVCFCWIFLHILNCFMWQFSELFAEKSAVGPYGSDSGFSIGVLISMWLTTWIDFNQSEALGFNVCCCGLPQHMQANKCQNDVPSKIGSMHQTG